MARRRSGDGEENGEHGAGGAIEPRAADGGIPDAEGDGERPGEQRGDAGEQ